jgi:hypothetical protein
MGGGAGGAPKAHSFHGTVAVNAATASITPLPLRPISNVFTCAKDRRLIPAALKFRKSIAM